MTIKVRAGPIAPLAQTGMRRRGGVCAGRDSEWDRCRAFSHSQAVRCRFTGQCLWGLAPPPLRNENLAAAGLTPARLGPVEAEGQCGAGACGTVDCCHERESQTHLWEAPAGGTSRHCHRGATRPQLTIERALPGPAGGQARFRMLGSAFEPTAIHKPATADCGRIGCAGRVGGSAGSRGEDVLCCAGVEHSPGRGGQRADRRVQRTSWRAP